MRPRRTPDVRRRERSAPRSDPGSAPVVGVDVGATKISAGTVGPDGRVIHRSATARTLVGGPDEMVEGIAGLVDSLPSEGGAVGPVGVGFAAQVDPVDGSIAYSPNLRWRAVPFGRPLAERLRRPVVVENDVRAATFGEWRHGVGAGSSDLLVVWAGTGVGGGVISGGRLLDGASHSVGEIGHLCVAVGGRKCSCPSQGCLEAYVGGWAIAERAREAVRSDPSAGAELARSAGSVDAIDARHVTSAARAGDRLAIELMRSTSDYLADGVVGLVNAFNPAVVVLGGGIVEGWPSIVGVVHDRVRSRCQPPAAEAARVVPAALGIDSVLVGAAALARERGRRIEPAAPGPIGRRAERAG